MEEKTKEAIIKATFELLKSKDMNSISIREIATKAKVNVATISYYFATATEMKLNDISRETTVFNDENAELENQLDKLKSFNNVDKSVSKNNMLTKAKQVIEVQEVNSTGTAKKSLDSQKIFDWAIGY